jgi:ribosomal protein S12 methylthiotransferase accessory factor YcaO
MIPTTMMAEGSKMAKVGATMAKKAAEGEKRIQVPVRLTQDVADRLDRIIWHTGKGRNKQNLLERAVLELIEKIEKEENKGKPFPPIPEEGGE